MLVANWIAATLYTILSIALVVKQKKRLADYFLLASILGHTGYLFSDIWVTFDLNLWSFAFHCLTAFSMFPPFFFYAMLLISKQHKVKSSWWWFMTFHWAYILFIILDLFVLNNYSLKDIELLYYSPTPKWQYLFFYKGLQVYTIVVMVWFLFKLKAYQGKIRDYYSNLEEVKLDWLMYFAWIYIITYGTAFVTMLSFNFGLLKDIKVAYMLINVSTVGILFWMFYRGLKQHVVANFSEPESNAIVGKKYAKSSLNETSSKELFKRINELFIQEKIFHNPDLKVQDIAAKLEVTNHNVSQVLNEIAGKSFYDFVNDYRLEYFKEQLKDPEKRRFTILALGMESGFNSKASLNRVFKQQLGITPREYQQQTLAS